MLPSYLARQALLRLDCRVLQSCTGDQEGKHNFMAVGPDVLTASGQSKRRVTAELKVCSADVPVKQMWQLLINTVALVNLTLIMVFG